MNVSVQSAVQNAGVALKENRIDDAIGELQSALVQAPDDFSTNHMLGAALIRAGRRPEAIARLLKATQLNPTHAAAHAHLGMAYAAANKHEMARNAFQTALRIDPGFAPAQNGIAKLPVPAPRNVPKGKVTAPLSAPVPVPAAASAAKTTAKVSGAKKDLKTNKISAKPAAPKKEIDWAEVTLQVLGGIFLVAGVYLKFVYVVENFHIYSLPGTICIVIGISMLKAGFPSKDDWKNDFR